MSFLNGILHNTKELPSETEMKEKHLSTRKNNPRRFLFLLKLSLGISLLLGLLLWNDNWLLVVELFSRVKWQFFLPLFVMSLILNWVSCLKWSLFLKDKDYHLSISRLLGLYLIGKFFSNFLPGVIGGDVMRTYLLGRQINSQSGSLVSVFLERFSGLVALTFLALTFSILNFDLLSNPVISVPVGLATLGCSLGVAFFFQPKLMAVFSSGLSFIPGCDQIFSKLEIVYRELLLFRKKYFLLLKAMIYSFMFHLLMTVYVFLICGIIGFHPSFLDIAVITPIILLMNTIPVSPNNLGWLEWCFSVLLVEAGGGIPQGLAVALTIRGISLITSTLGGVLYLLEKSNHQCPKPSAQWAIRSSERSHDPGSTT